MKNNERNEARRLREVEGLPIGQIAEKLGVAKSSVSLWVRDIALTAEQKAHLLELNPVYNQQLNGSSAVSQKCRKLRKQYQEEGKKKAREGDVLHAIGCMLYWGEGAKTSCDLKMSNSNLNLLRLFKRFLNECYDVPDEAITVRIYCYSNSPFSAASIEQYWLQGLSLSKSNLRKTVIDRISKCSLRKKKPLTYGTCHMVVHNVKIIQSIYGALQEYGQFTDDTWLS